MDIPYTSNSVLAALQNLNQQTNRVEREAVMKGGLKDIFEMVHVGSEKHH